MVETERTAFAVTTTGIGRPDYTPEVAAGKLITGKLQTRFSMTWDWFADAGGSAGALVYTVPAGFKLHLGSVICSCDASIIQMFDLYYFRAGVAFNLIADYRYDVNGQIILGPENTLETIEGDQVWFEVFNNDIVQRAFSVNIQGFLERVA